MMQSELLLQPSSPTHFTFHSNHNQYELNMNFYASEDHGFPSITTTPENSSPDSSLSNFNLLSDDCVEYPWLVYDHTQNTYLDENVSQNMEGLEDVCKWLCNNNQPMEEIQSERSLEGGDVWSPSLSTKSSEGDAYISYETPMLQTDDAMEIESQTGLQNLLKAYAEAMGMGQRQLANVIMKCITEKASPIGPALERMALSLFRCVDNQGEEYLKQESRRNFKPAFRAFYDIFPYGRFAHFMANSAILNAIPIHVDSVHIVDFDMGEGAQWAPVIEAIASRRKSMTITSVKLEENSGFEETKRHLCNYARSVGLNLKVEEMDLAHMVNGVGGTKLGREFLALNCMIDLPHMGKRRRRTQVMEFLEIANELLSKNEGITIFGDGEDSEGMGNSSDYTSFFDGHLAHYKALYESIEWGFPSYLTEARMAMETLFITPFVSSLSWFQKWEEGREDVVARRDLGLKGQAMSRESVNEARELVKEGESPYKIGIGGDCANEMVLEWRGTPLVRVSAWMKMQKNSEL